MGGYLKEGILSNRKLIKNFKIFYKRKISNYKIQK